MGDCEAVIPSIERAVRRMKLGQASRRPTDDKLLSDRLRVVLAGDMKMPHQSGSVGLEEQPARRVDRGDDRLLVLVAMNDVQLAEVMTRLSVT